MPVLDGRQMPMSFCDTCTIFSEHPGGCPIEVVIHHNCYDVVKTAIFQAHQAYMKGAAASRFLKAPSSADVRWLIDFASIAHLVQQLDPELPSLLLKISDRINSHFTELIGRYIDEFSVEAELSSTPSLRAKKTQQPDPGYVYLLETKDGIYKIGKSKRPEVRTVDLGIMLPYECKLIHTIKVEYAIESEANLHRLFHGKRLRGEWFKLADSDVAWICSLSSMDKISATFLGGA